VKPKIELKYRIKERMELLTHGEYQFVIKTLPAALNISSRTFFRYMYTGNASGSDHLSSE
jgi:hypothetical protein